ncbi:hypothetical protein TPL01_08280 [Sulfuriferula plumbiphila]|uniref:Uncharacterized protein n=1 Tax=Sulfuriferula plumbiphila TaxID=171865 RepID=A0A512L5E7_9PROT|nr:hypothetical protein SFPGR_09610 [Sulfuriferula plumbiphila]GEP29690.1 hypothetical protein TPL01_08280 [Sulfuriferula plumbiphila]
MTPDEHNTSAGQACIACHMSGIGIRDTSVRQVAQCNIKVTCIAKESGFQTFELPKFTADEMAHTM